MLDAINNLDGLTPELAAKFGQATIEDLKDLIENSFDDLFILTN